MKFQLICLVALFAFACTSPIPQDDKAIVPEVVTELKSEPQAKVEAAVKSSPESDLIPVQQVKTIENKQENSEISATEPKQVEQSGIAEIPIEGKLENAAKVAIVELKEESKPEVAAPVDVIPETKLVSETEVETSKVEAKSEDVPTSNVEEAVRQVRETEVSKIEEPAPVAVVEAVKSEAKTDAKSEAKSKDVASLAEAAPETPTLKTEEPAAPVATIEEKTLPAATEDLPAPVAKLAESEQMAVPESKSVDTALTSEPAAAPESDPTTVSTPTTAASADGESAESNESPEEKASAESNESKVEA